MFLNLLLLRYFHLILINDPIINFCLNYYNLSLGNFMFGIIIIIITAIVIIVIAANFIVSLLNFEDYWLMRFLILIEKREHLILNQILF